MRAAKALYEPALRLGARRHEARCSRAAALRSRRASRWCRRLGSEFLPELNEGAIWVNVHAADQRLGLGGAGRLCSRCAPRSAQVPEVRSVISKAGRPEDGTDPKLINMAEFLVDLKPETEWRAASTKREAARARWTRRSRQTPGPRAELLAADPRQRAGEHLADRRPDRDQGVRRRPRQCCDDKAREVLDAGARRAGRGARLHRPRGRAAADPDRGRPRARRALRPQRRRRRRT